MQRLLISFAVLSLIMPSAASAKLYKCENDKGEVIYTDQACQEGKGKELKLAPFSTYKPNILPVPAATNTEQPDPVASYKSLEIVSPENDKLVFSNTGTVTVAFKLDGPLLSLKGHKFAIALDGKRLKSRGVTNQIRLDRVERGTHTLQVFVVDTEDKTIKSSNLVSFHMQGRSRLNSPTPGKQDLTKTIPGSSNTIPGGAGTIPGGSPNIPGGKR